MGKWPRDRLWIISSTGLIRDAAGFEEFRGFRGWLDMQVENIHPGQRVGVTQQIPHRNGGWTTRVTGRVVKVEQRKTGSWFAHAKDDKLWLDRLTLCKDDGEIVVCILDRYTSVEILAEAPTTTENAADSDESPVNQDGESADAA